MPVIRPATTADYDDVCALYGELDALHVAAHPERYQRVEPARSRQWLDELLADDDRALLIAEFDGDVAGFADLLVRRGSAHPLHRDRSVGIIDGLMIADGVRGRGIGKALMEASDAWFESRAVDDIEVNAYAFNDAAIRFYEANGFRPLMVRLAKQVD